MFVLASIAVAFGLGLPPPGAILYAAGAACVLMPPLWWWVVARGGKPGIGRGAMAGGVSAVLLWLTAFVLGWVWWKLTTPKGQAGLSDMVLVFAILAAIPIAAAVGALLGMLAVHAENRWMRWGPGGGLEIASRPAVTPHAASLRTLVSETWLGTLVFIMPIVLLYAFHGLPPTADRLIPPLVITPIVWWWMVGRHPQLEIGLGSMAGVVIAIGLVLCELGLYPQDLKRAGLPATPDPSTLLMVFGLLLLVQVPVGAVLGSVAVLLQRAVRGRFKSPSAPAGGA